VVDQRLLDLVRTGDVAGLAGLYDRHGSACLQAASLLGPTEAEAVVFDIFMTTWRDPPTAGNSLRQNLLDRTTEKVLEFERRADVKILLPAPTPL
jgi:hypothetical protein